ncbi:DUF3558 domain-containing protein [Streptomyces sp. NPDC058657]|uniref:DUF3558 domain-containing protein n=1 Tax=unclassified Streptomyces TaxID=2593676 RepID=UPI00364F214B
MPRQAGVKAYARACAPGIALLAALAAGTAGCSGGASDGDGTTDSKPGENSSPAAQPGKYRTLPEPCRAVERAQLKDMLPGAAALPEDQRQKLFAGEAAVTFDTDRRVGCRWKVESPEHTHQLVVDFERVVSYDTAVSDDDRAQTVYAELVGAADLPAPRQTSPDPAASATAPGTAQPSGTPGPGSPTGPPVTGTSGSPSGSGTPTAPPLDDLQPRTLDGLGDAAFLDDVQAKAGTSSAQDRTVSVVFRTSNVIVSIKYAEQPGRTDQVPDSRTLQDRAQGLARKLAEQFSSSE